MGYGSLLIIPILFFVSVITLKATKKEKAFLKWVNKD